MVMVLELYNAESLPDAVKQWHIVKKVAEKKWPSAVFKKELKKLDEKKVQRPTLRYQKYCEAK